MPDMAHGGPLTNLTQTFQMWHLCTFNQQIVLQQLTAHQFTKCTWSVCNSLLASFWALQTKQESLETRLKACYNVGDTESSHRKLQIYRKM